MKRSGYSILCCAFLVIHFSGKSQASEIDFPVFSIRTNPFSFIETDAGIQVGMGYQWKKKWGATLDPTFIFYIPVQPATINGNRNKRDLKTGIKIRSDVRFYFGEGFRSRNSFIGPELHYKYVSSKKWADFGINCIGQQCDYYMTTTYKEIKKEIGIALKAGFTRPLSTRLAVEAFGGVGVRFRHIKERDLPIGGSFIAIPVHDDVFGAPDGKPTTYVPIGIKLVYSFINKNPGSSILQ